MKSVIHVRHASAEPGGETIAADVLHRAELASLHDEFAEVLETRAALARLGG